MTEQELFNALRPLYPSAEYALLPQVSNGTGARTGARTCDALALSLWPSRGIHMHGFEMKSSRSDWTRELANPAKAEEIAKYCNYWWIVTGYIGMVKDGELPVGWGLLEFDPEKQVLIKKAKAPCRDATTPDMLFVAAMLRKAQGVVTPEAVINAAREEGFTQGRQAGESNGKYNAQELLKLKKYIADVEKSAGIKFDTWRPGNDIGQAIHQVLTGTVEVYRERLVKAARATLKTLGEDVSA